MNIKILSLLIYICFFSACVSSSKHAYPVASQSTSITSTILSRRVMSVAQSEGDSMNGRAPDPALGRQPDRDGSKHLPITDQSPYSVKQKNNAALLPKEKKRVSSLIGASFPNVTLTTINKERHTINQFHGRVLLLHFWATWCPPCRNEFESLQQLQNSFDRNQFEIAAISHDVSLLDIIDFINNKNIDITIYFDSRTKIINRVYPGNNGLLPISILVDKEGKIADLIIGVQSWSSQAMRKKINDLVLK